MSKTFIYLLVTICVFLFVVKGIGGKAETTEETNSDTYEGSTANADTENGTGLAENADENVGSQGASGQMKYRIGYTK